MRALNAWFQTESTVYTLITIQDVIYVTLAGGIVWHRIKTLS